MIEVAFERRHRILLGRFIGVFSSDDIEALDRVVKKFVHENGPVVGLMDWSDVDTIAVQPWRLVQRGRAPQIALGQQARDGRARRPAPRHGPRLCRPAAHYGNLEPIVVRSLEEAYDALRRRRSGVRTGELRRVRRRRLVLSFLVLSFLVLPFPVLSFFWRHEHAPAASADAQAAAARKDREQRRQQQARRPPAAASRERSAPSSSITATAAMPRTIWPRCRPSARSYDMPRSPRACGGQPTARPARMPSTNTEWNSIITGASSIENTRLEQHAADQRQGGRHRTAPAKAGRAPWRAAWAGTASRTVTSSSGRAHGRYCIAASWGN